MLRSDLEKLVAHWRARHALLRGYRGFSAGEAFALREVADELDALLRASGDGWMSVSNELPPAPGWYIALNYRVVEPLRWDGTNWHHTRMTRDLALPTHWQPLPTPPATQRADQAEDA